MVKAPPLLSKILDAVNTRLSNFKNTTKVLSVQSFAYAQIKWGTTALMIWQSQGKCSWNEQRNRQYSTSFAIPANLTGLYRVIREA